MKVKTWHILIVALLLVATLIPTYTAKATVYNCTATNPCSCSGGQGCWNRNPQYTYRTINGTTQYCGTNAITVTGSYKQSGTNGRVRVEERWSSWCVTNWSRGTVVTSVSTSKQLGVKAVPIGANSGYYSARYYRGSPLPAGYYNWSWMVDGSGYDWAYAGINGTNCNGNTDNDGLDTGWPCSYNPLAYYRDY